jgi:hypothetical protein
MELTPDSELSRVVDALFVRTDALAFASLDKFLTLVREEERQNELQR